MFYTIQTSLLNAITKLHAVVEGRSTKTSHTLIYLGAF